MAVPRRWNPVNLDGDFSRGHALLADALRPRMGLRWSTPSRRQLNAVRAERAAMAAMTVEVGVGALDHVKPFAMTGTWLASVSYTAPTAPGRDVWVGYSALSGRLLTIVYHAYRRARAFANVLLPGIVEYRGDRAMPWAVFDLRCVAPAGMRLIAQRLNAGDLGLTFADPRHELTVRQIAVAQLALARQPLDRWIEDQQRTTSRHYRAVDGCSDVQVNSVIGRSARMVRRRRHLSWWRPAEYVTLALHDRERDRIVILHGTDQAMLREVAATVAQRRAR